MTMLEDELREMFHARVHTPPAAMDPAGVAIKRGEGKTVRRRTVIGTVSVVLFLAILGAVASIEGVWGTPERGEDRYTLDVIDGMGGVDQPSRSGESLPIVAMPVDVHVGTALWTTDGRRLTLPGVADVVDVVRVPDGWLYSDDFRLHLLTVGGQLVPVGSNVSTWTVSNDGGKVATVTDGTVLAVKTPSGDQKASTAVPTGSRAVAFDGGRVVLSRGDRAGSDSWSGSHTAYRDTWDDKLMVVYGGHGEDAVGLYQQGPAVCLVDLTAGSDGWHIGTMLGCGDLLTTAAKAGYGLSRGARSPDGRWLAVPSPTGVHIVDLPASRATAQAHGPQGGPPVVAHTCLSSPDAPAVWADATTMLTVSVNNGVIACGTDGSRAAVQLPSGVSDGWALVRRFGVTG